MNDWGIDDYFIMGKAIKKQEPFPTAEDAANSKGFAPTGDATNIFGNMIVLIVSLFGIIAAFFARKRRL